MSSLFSCYLSNEFEVFLDLRIGVLSDSGAIRRGFEVRLENN